MSKLFAVVNDDILPLENVCIPLTDTYYLNGVGVYETLKLRSGKLFFVQDHLDRLFQSASIIGLKIHCSRELLLRRLHHLVNSNQASDMNVRIILVKKNEDSVNSYVYPVSIPFRAGNKVTEYPQPMGLSVMLYHGERHFAQAKSLSMLLSNVALNQAKINNCWDSILIDRNGELCEGTRSNLYWVKNDTLYISKNEKILSGVTRSHFIHALEQEGEKVHRSKLILKDFLAAPCPLLISSTSIAIQPVTRVLSADSRWIILPKTPRIQTFARIFSDYLRELS